MRKNISLVIAGVLFSFAATASFGGQPVFASSTSSVSTWKLDMARPLSNSLKCPGVKASITYELVPGFGPGKQVTVQWYDNGKKDAKQTMTGDSIGWHLIGQGKNTYKYDQPASAMYDGVTYKMFMGSNSGASVRWWYQGILNQDEMVDEYCPAFLSDIKFSKNKFRIIVKSIAVVFASQSGIFDGRGGSNIK